MNGQLSYEDDLHMLKYFEKYKCDDRDIVFCYNNHDPIYSEIKNFLPIQSFETATSNFDLHIKLMFWAHLTLSKAVGVSDNPKAKNFFSIMESVNNLSEGTNCLSFATVLNEIFLAFGYKSRLVQCLPIDLRSTECHCLTVVYSDEYKRWIVFDPAFGTYYADENNLPIDMIDLRYRLSKQLTVNTPFVPRVRRKSLLKYLTKNMIRFQCFAENKFNMVADNKDSVVYQLIPLGITLNDKIITREQGTRQIIYTTDQEKFWRIP